MPAPDMPKLDILIPVYNEGENIVQVLTSLRENVNAPFRVLLCYDFDEDNTLAAIRGAGDLGIDIVYVKNRGNNVHSAILTGFESSTAPAVLVFPADDFYNAAVIDDMYRKLMDNNDIIAASRFMKGGCMKGCPWLKAFLVRSAAITMYLIARIPTRDPSNGFRMFSERLVEQVEIESTDGFAYSIELLVKCHRLGWGVAEVPVSWLERQSGTSRFRVLKWLPAYLRWYFYGFATTFLRRPASSVKLRGQNAEQRD